MRPTLKKYKHPTRTELKWVLRWDEGGRRKRQYFTKTDEAKGAFERKNAEWLAVGAQSSRMTDAKRLEALRCFEKLEACGCTLTEAVDFFIEDMKRKQAVSQVSIGDCLEKFIAMKEAQGLRHRTTKSLQNELDAFFHRRLKKPASSITRQDCERYITQADHPRTQTNRRQRLHAFFAWTTKQGFTPSNPCNGIEVARVVNNEPSILTLDQARRFMQAAHEYENGKLIPYCTLALFAGIRPRELERLDWDAVNLQDKHVTISGAHAKLRSRRLVELSDNAVAWLIPHALEKTPIAPPNLRNHLKAIREASGLTDWPQDVLRHTCLTMKLASGCTEAETASFAGNSPGTLHAFYRGLANKKTASAFWGIRPDSKQVIPFEEATA